MLVWTAGAAADTPQSGVLVYDAAFFADQRPNTAYDMIGRLPGFSFTNTGSARGFAGNAGNVLIDGQRPTSKSDDLESILTRIPAADVERIELIRGGAPGIDMQGLTVIANVIRKKGSSTQWVLDATENIFQDGHTVPGLTLNFTEHDGDKTFEASALALRRLRRFRRQRLPPGRHVRSRRHDEPGRRRIRADRAAAAASRARRPCRCGAARSRAIWRCRTARSIRPRPISRARTRNTSSTIP